MRKLSSSSPTQTKLVSYRWTKAAALGENPSCEAKQDLAHCASKIPICGAKQARGAVGDDILLRSSPIPPIWGAKRARSSASFSGGPDWRDWANLGDGPAGLIAERLLADDVADYVSFRAVCRPWRLCSTDPHSHGVLDRRFHPRQWIMLKGIATAGASPYRRYFLNICSGNSRYVDLPELHGHDVFGPTTEGLLVLLDTTTYMVRLLNPFTRQAAKLPPATTLMIRKSDNRTRVLLSVSGAGLADDSTIAVHFGSIRTLAVAKPGDGHWIVVDRGMPILPAMSFAGRFYCATNKAVMVVEMETADHKPRLAIAAFLSRPFYRMMLDTVHLVDNDGELVLVDRECHGHRKYMVHRLDLDARKMVPLRGLGGRAVFMGSEGAISVSPSLFPSISADTIYLGFETLMTSRLDNSPIHLMDDTSHPRQFKDRPYGPSPLDEYLSWCVTGYGDTFRTQCDLRLFCYQFCQSSHAQLIRRTSSCASF